MRRFVWVVVLTACGDGGGGVDGDVGAVADASTDADADAAANAAEVVPATLPASDYCEAIVESFCDYYVRCGRMAVPDVASCRPVFLETCNARYEPLWATLADDDRLTLSTAGIAACADWLDDVSCEQQQNDLDWGCAEVWRGDVAAGGACGPGLESFVCARGTTCIIDLDFCGECVPLAAAGEACDLAHRCPPIAECVEGACVDRTKVGRACAPADVVGCVLGAGCVDGTCRADTYVSVGDACDLDHRCPYKSVCMGTCREAALIGGACETSFECASGYCADGTCVPLLVEGDACTSSGACTSGRCDPETHVCTAITFACEP